MKYFIDGDQVVITRDDFVNLQESPAIFIPSDSDAGRIIQQHGIVELPLFAVYFVWDRLMRNGGLWNGKLDETPKLIRKGVASHPLQKMGPGMVRPAPKGSK